VLENKNIRLKWSKVLDLDVAGYEIRTLDTDWGSSGEVYRGSATTITVNPEANTTIWYAKAFDRSGNYSLQASAVQFTKAAIESPTGLVFKVEEGVLYLTWAAVTGQLGDMSYEVRSSNSGWGTPGEVYRGTGNITEVNPSAQSTTWYVKSFDRFGVYSATATSSSYAVPAVARVSDVSHLFADTSLTAATVTLSWVDAEPTFGLSNNELSYEDTTITVKANTITVPANWIGNRDFSIVTVDRFGFRSTPVNYPITKLRPDPALNFRAQVIDNNVLLYWTLPTKTSLPIAHVKIRKGDSWASADEVGTKDGEFTTIFELSGGEFSYWLAVVDTDGYESDPVKLTTAVTQPPDFLFLGELNSTFSGTKVNAVTEDSRLVLPVNLIETQQQHFDTRSWAGPSAQVSAGFPVFIQPGLASGYYEEIFDFGTVVASSSVTVILGGSNISGNPSKNLTLSLSDDLTDWTVYLEASQVFATNFRYVRVKYAVAQVTAGDLFSIDQLTVRLDTKTFTDSGTVAASASDVAGTPVNFNFEVLDVLSINTTVNSTMGRQAVYDFRDETLTGTYSVVSSVATLTFATPHGLRAGQNVRIAPTSGTLARSVYEILQVVNANSYTIAAATPNASGGCVAYPNSFSVFVFDSAGVRQSNIVSWNMRGS
jgi:hypothetical protein